MVWRLCVDFGEILVHEPLLLFRDSHVAVVQKYGIVGLAQRRYLAVGVDVVALLHILKDILLVGLHTLGLELIVTALGTHLGRGGDKNLELGIGEDGGAYVAAVHHDALVAAHSLLLLDHG